MGLRIMGTIFNLINNRNRNPRRWLQSEPLAMHLLPFDLLWTSKAAHDISAETNIHIGNSENSPPL